MKEFGFETRSIHAGAAPDAATGARNTPIYQTTSKCDLSGIIRMASGYTHGLTIPEELLG